MKNKYIVKNILITKFYPMPFKYALTKLQHSLHLPLSRKWQRFLKNASGNHNLKICLISIICSPFCQFYKKVVLLLSEHGDVIERHTLKV